MKTAGMTVSNAAMGLAAGAGGLVLAGAALGGAAVLIPVSWSGPDWSLLAAQSPVIKAHLAAAVAALLIGGVLMAGPKGRRFHRSLGWACAVLVMLAAVSSFWIRGPEGQFSLIHGLSAWVTLAMPVAVLAARRHQVVRHRRMMSGLFYGGLVVAGLFAFVPGRVLFQTFFG